MNSDLDNPNFNNSTESIELFVSVNRSRHFHVPLSSSCLPFYPV